MSASIGPVAAELSAAPIDRHRLAMACRRLIDHAAAELGATEIYAGVTHGNERSMALLHRLGFEAVERFDSYARFRLVIETARSTPTR